MRLEIDRARECDVLGEMRNLCQGDIETHKWNCMLANTLTYIWVNVLVKYTGIDYEGILY